MNFMMFALATAVTFLRPFSTAYSKAYCTMRRAPVTEIGLMRDGAVRADLALRPCAMICFASGVPRSYSTPGVEVLGVLADDHQVHVRRTASGLPGSTCTGRRQA